MKKYLLIILIVTFFMPHSMVSAGSLDEQGFLYRILENAFEVKIVGMDRKIARETEIAAKTPYALGLFMNIGRTASTNSEYEQVVEMASDSVVLGVSRLLKSHGLLSLELGGSASNSLIKPYGVGTDFPIESAVPYISIGFMQPLLKSGIIHMPGKVLVDLNKNVKELTLLGARMSLEYFIYNSLVKYHRLITDIAIQEVNRKALADSRELYEKYSKRYELGAIDRTELLKFESQVDLQELNLNKASKQIQNDMEAIKMYLNEEIDFTILPDTFLLENKKYNQADTIKRALENKVDIIQAKVIINNSELNLASARNSTLPELNVNMSYKFKGYLYGEGLAGIPGELASLADYSDVYVGGELKVPFLSPAERARVLKADYELEKAKYDKHLKELLLEVEIKNRVRNLEMVSREFQVYKDTAKKYVEILEQAKKDYDRGRITARELLQTRDDLRRMETGYILARLQRRAAVLAIELEQGSLLEVYGVNIKE